MTLWLMRIYITKQSLATEGSAVQKILSRQTLTHVCFFKPFCDQRSPEHNNQFFSLDDNNLPIAYIWWQNNYTFRRLKKKQSYFDYSYKPSLWHWPWRQNFSSFFCIILWLMMMHQVCLQINGWTFHKADRHRWTDRHGVSRILQFMTHFQHKTLSQVTKQQLDHS